MVQNPTVTHGLVPDQDARSPTLSETVVDAVTIDYIAIMMETRMRSWYPPLISIDLKTSFYKMGKGQKGAT